jgi:serine/threonine-protein kinase RIO1
MGNMISVIDGGKTMSDLYETEKMSEEDAGQDTEQWKNDFPILKRKMRNKELVYLDSAATSQKPAQVIEALNRYYREYNANIHRGSYLLCKECNEFFEKSRGTGKCSMSFLQKRPDWWPLPTYQT